MVILENLFGVSERRIQQLVDEDVVVRLAHGSYLLRESITAYVKYLRESMQNQPVSDEEKLQRLRYAKYKADIAELDLKKRNKELVNRYEERQLAFLLARNLRSALENMSVRVAPIVAVENDQYKVHNLLLKEIKDILKTVIESNKQINLTDY